MLVHNMNFNVAGVTFKNEEGKDIQKEIKRVMNEYKKNEYFSDGLYNGYTNKEIKEYDLNVSEFEGYNFPIKFVGDEYEGQPCFKIYLKAYNDDYVHIGYIPKENLSEVTEWLTRDLNIMGTLKIVGGKYKHCEIVEKDYEEKEIIEIEELNYGETRIVITPHRFKNNLKDRRLLKRSYDNQKEEEKENIIKNNKKNFNFEKYGPPIIMTIVCIVVFAPIVWGIIKIFNFLFN